MNRFWALLAMAVAGCAAAPPAPAVESAREAYERGVRDGRQAEAWRKEQAQRDAEPRRYPVPEPVIIPVVIEQSSTAIVIKEEGSNANHHHHHRRKVRSSCWAWRDLANWERLPSRHCDSRFEKSPGHHYSMRPGTIGPVPERSRRVNVPRDAARRRPVPDRRLENGGESKARRTSPSSRSGKVNRREDNSQIHPRPKRRCAGCATRTGPASGSALDDAPRSVGSSKARRRVGGRTSGGR